MINPLLKLKFKSVKISVLLCGLLLLGSCKVYYNTGDVDGQLSKTSTDAENSCNRLTQQIKSMQQEYEALNCNQESPDFTAAKSKLNEINSGLTEMAGLSRNIKEEYGNFSAYTKGKSKIESGTTEWNNFKQTKKKVKLNAELLQKKGEENIKKATEFHQFVSQKIVPTVKYCDVASTLNQFETTLKDLGKSQKKFSEEFTVFEKTVSGITQKFLATHPEKCNAVNGKLKKMSAANAGITKIKSGILQQISQFRKATSGKTKVYSCSSEWEAVSRAEQEFSGLNKELASIEQSLQELSTQIQNDINEIK